VARVRGTDLRDAVAFVADTYGPGSTDLVLGGLPQRTRALFARNIRQLDWYPLEALTSYLVTAKGLLDPDGSDFYRKQGYYAAQHRKRGPLQMMVASPELRMLLVRTVWRLFYDVGRIEVLSQDPANVATRIHDFPATPELCERFRGIWEGMASEEGRPARAEGTRCVLRGDPYCELRVVYGPKGSST